MTDQTATAPPGGADQTAAERIAEVMETGDRAAWIAAALSLVAGDRVGDARRRGAEAVLAAVGVPVDFTAEVDRAGVAAQAAAPLLQTSALLRDGADLWVDQPDEAILAQGRASAQGAAAFARLALPALVGLSDAFVTPGVRMLDVGTGVAAMAVAYAELFPELTVVGIDVLPRVLALAAATVAGSTVADRVVLREQSVSALDDDAAYALAWVPAPFVPEPALLAGLPRVARALVPGGWLMLGYGRLDEDPLSNAVTRFKTVCYGGTALDNGQAQALLTDAGLVDVMTVPTPPGTPALTVGRRPPDGR